MRTEIVIPFAFDTTPIEAMLQTRGKEEAMRILYEMIEKNVIQQMPKKANYYGTKTNEPDWKLYIDGSFRNWLDDHAEEIIDEAALLLAAKAGRKKKWKEVLKEIKEEDES